MHLPTEAADTHRAKLEPTSCFLANVYHLEDDMTGDHAYRIPMPGLTLRIMLPRAFKLRVKIALMFIQVASWFMPLDTEIEVVDREHS